MGIEIASALAKLYPGKFEVGKMIALVGNASTIKQLMKWRRSRRDRCEVGQGTRGIPKDAGKILAVPVRRVDRLPSLCDYSNLNRPAAEEAFILLRSCRG